MKNIEMGKKYRCRDGVPVTVLAVGLNAVYPVVFVRHTPESGDYVISHNADGKCANTYDSPMDLIEIGPYDDFKIDDKVMVSNCGRQWLKAYFAGVSESGRPTSFAGRVTEWVSTGVYVSWNYCRRPTLEELAE